MRFLFTTQPLPGHFRPLVPVARALQDLGHDVLVASAPFFVPDIQQYGFEAASVGSETPVDGNRIAAENSQASVDPVERAEVLILARETSGAVLADLLSLLDSWRPDLIVRDSAEFGVYVAAECRRIPHVTIGSSLATSLFSRRWLFCDEINTLRERHGLQADEGCESLFRWLHAEFMPRSFFTGPDELPPTTRHYRHESVVRPEDAGPSWFRDLPDQPTVLVNLGTLSREPRLLLTIYRALRDEPLNLVLKTPVDDAATFRRISRPNVRISHDVSPPGLLPACDLFITHGGYNAVKESIRVGVPMLLMPLFGDQPFIGARCQELGIGRALATSDSEGIRAVVRSALHDAVLRQNVVAMRDEMLHLPDVIAATTALEELVRQTE